MVGWCRRWYEKFWSVVRWCTGLERAEGQSTKPGSLTVKTSDACTRDQNRETLSRLQTVPRQYFCRTMLCISTAYAIMQVCLCVCPFCAFYLNEWKYLQNFSPSGSQAILVFPYQTAWRYSNRSSPDGGVESRWGRQKSRFRAYIWLHYVLLTLRPARCYQQGATSCDTYRW